MLFRLCAFDKAHTHTVISLTSYGKYGPQLREKGIETIALNLGPTLPSLVGFFKLLFLLRSRKPNVVQTWMYHADFLGGIAARVVGVKALVWGVRASFLEPQTSSRLTVLLVKLLAKLSSKLPSLVAVCAQRGIDFHQKFGYQRDKMRFVPNGYDFSDFFPRTGSTNSLRENLKLERGTALIGMVARFDSYKDHSNLLQALAILGKKGIDVKCMLVGAGLDNQNINLLSKIQRLCLQDKVILLGASDDISSIMRGLDLHVLSSLSEGFPNVVAEAMACGTPCVVTDVGDAAFIVGDTGWVVPPCNSDALAAAIEDALIEKKSTAWNTRCVAARNRIVQNFSIEKMVENYHEIWKEAILFNLR